MFAKNTSRYTYVAIVLHWAIAALILFMIWLGWNMDENEARYQLHKSIGISILFLTVTRIIWRRMNPPPRPSDHLSLLERNAAHFVHMAFYWLMIGIPLLGWLLVSISKFQVPTVLFGVVSWPHLPFTSGLRGGGLTPIVEFLHSKSAWLLLVLLALHVAGAVKHQFVGDAPVLKRMLPGLLGPTRPPRYGAFGHLQAFGTAALLFLIVIALPIVGNTFGSITSAFSSPRDTETVAEDPVSASPRMLANWAVDYDASEIRFSGVHDDKPFSGVFERWTADVAFDPDDLENSEVNVVVQTASARTGRKLYDDSLRVEEWFNVSTFDEAQVRVSDFRRTNDGYTSTATLSLKGKVVSVPLDFTLNITGKIATLFGEATVSREPLELGQISDPGALWVSEDISITLSGIAYAVEAGTPAADIVPAPVSTETDPPIQDDPALMSVTTRIDAVGAAEDEPADTAPEVEVPLATTTVPEPETAIATEQSSPATPSNIEAAPATVEPQPQTPEPARDTPRSFFGNAPTRPDPAPAGSPNAPQQSPVLDDYALEQIRKATKPDPVEDRAE